MGIKNKNIFSPAKELSYITKVAVKIFCAIYTDYRLDVYCQMENLRSRLIKEKDSLTTI